MRKLIVLSFVSLDGVMQAPGGPEEDPSGGFRYGGWVFPFADEFFGEEMNYEINRDFELLLGRKTYDIFAAYWPFADTKNDPIAESFNRVRKYVVTTTIKNPEWKNSQVISENIPGEIRKLKENDGPDLQVHGSGNLIQTLLKYDLVDELWLKIFPVVLGSGKRLFEEGSFAGGFRLTESKISPSGVFIGYYKRDGEVQTGLIGS